MSAYLDLSPFAHDFMPLYVALEERDLYTRGHCDRTTQLTTMLGEKSGLSSRDMAIAHFSATFHDIGKIGIPDYVLLKEGALDKDERHVIQSHPEKGRNIVLAFGSGDTEQAANAIYHHHERFDGTGYPKGLAGTDIPIVSRLIALADTYDAMATRRVYSAARPHNKIVETLWNGRGTHYDPDLCSLFIDMMESQDAAPWRATATG